MFKQQDYNDYSNKQEIADSVFKSEGMSAKAVAAQNEADMAYRRWEQAAGMRSVDDD